MEVDEKILNSIISLLAESREALSPGTSPRVAKDVAERIDTAIHVISVCGVCRAIAIDFGSVVRTLLVALRSGSTDAERQAAFVTVTAAFRALVPDFDQYLVPVDRDN